MEIVGAANKKKGAKGEVERERWTRIHYKLQMDLHF